MLQFKSQRINLHGTCYFRIRYIIKKNTQKNLVPSPHSQAKRKLSSFQILSCSSKNLTHRDCTNQILEYMEEINLDLEFQDIANKPNMSKDKFKIWIGKFQKQAFRELLEKKSSRIAKNSRGKHIKHEKLLMQEYLTETDVKLSCDDRKWLFKCRTSDIDLKVNFKWRYEQHTCRSCRGNLLKPNLEQNHTKMG